MTHAYGRTEGGFRMINQFCWKNIFPNNYLIYIENDQLLIFGTVNVKMAKKFSCIYTKFQAFWLGIQFEHVIDHTYTLLFWKTVTNKCLAWRRKHTLPVILCSLQNIPKILWRSLHYFPRGLPPSVQSAARPIIGLPSWESSFSWSHWLLYTLNLHTIYIIY